MTTLKTIAKQIIGRVGVCMLCFSIGIYGLIEPLEVLRQLEDGFDD